MSAQLARSLGRAGPLRRGACDAPTTCCASPASSPISVILASAVVARDRGRVAASDDGELLDRAWQLAVDTGEAQRIVPVAAALAEAAWLAGDGRRPRAALDTAWAVVRNHAIGWEVGEIAYWRARPGCPIDTATPLARAVRAACSITGGEPPRRVGGARLPAVAGDCAGRRPDASTRPASALDDRRRARSAGGPAAHRCGPARGRPAGAPRAAGRHRATTPPRSPPASSRCCGCSPRGCPTPRSPIACSCRRRPSGITCRRCCASSASRPAPARSRRAAGSGVGSRGRDRAPPR